ncbi:MAG: hypothetical protein JSS27_06330 [Planctomycetes bacterium]|nr:hypothetical protein [Planctomycetota bacterium]
MLTFFTAPKPFTGHAAIIQRNALASWKRLSGCQLILCGDDVGVAEAAAEFGALHLPQVDRNQYGTPLLDSMFATARQHATQSLLCYVNCDIIFFNDLLQAVRRAQRQNFLLVGKRRNIDVNEPLDCRDPNWETSLRQRVVSQGKLAPNCCIDYMIFPKDSRLSCLPSFAVGRPAWDNWFIGNARRLNTPVIDATDVVMAVHQNHGYAHVSKNRGIAWEGPEADENRRLAGWHPKDGPLIVHTIDDATHSLTANGLRRTLSLVNLSRQMINKRQAQILRLRARFKNSKLSRLLGTMRGIRVRLRTAISLARRRGVLSGLSYLQKRVMRKIGRMTGNLPDSRQQPALADGN